jgi:uncharacterized protein YecT (DUF1311 family)
MTIDPLGHLPDGRTDGRVQGRIERRIWSPRAIVVGAGVVGALALGLGLGFAARPDLGAAPAHAPMQPASVAAQPLSVEVNPPAPPEAVRPAGKLEVLPPDMAQAAAQTSRTYSAGDATLRWSGEAPQPQPVRSVGSSADCEAAASRAAQMVCEDPDLAAADRELNQAYRRALRSGAPVDQLREEQRDWLAIREDAARHSPRALANVYEQRIDDLNQIADDGPGEGPGA